MPRFVRKVNQTQGLTVPFAAVPEGRLRNHPQRDSETGHADNMEKIVAGTRPVTLEPWEFHGGAQGLSFEILEAFGGQGSRCSSEAFAASRPLPEISLRDGGFSGFSLSLAFRAQAAQLGRSVMLHRRASENAPVALAVGTAVAETEQAMKSWAKATAWIGSAGPPAQAGGPERLLCRGDPLFIEFAFDLLSPEPVCFFRSAHVVRSCLVHRVECVKVLAGPEDLASPHRIQPERAFRASKSAFSMVPMTNQNVRFEPPRVRFPWFQCRELRADGQQDLLEALSARDCTHQAHRLDLVTEQAARLVGMWLHSWPSRAQWLEDVQNTDMYLYVNGRFIEPPPIHESIVRLFTAASLQAQEGPKDWFDVAVGGSLLQSRAQGSGLGGSAVFSECYGVHRTRCSDAANIVPLLAPIAVARGPAAPCQTMKFGSLLARTTRPCPGHPPPHEGGRAVTSIVKKKATTHWKVAPIMVPCFAVPLAMPKEALAEAESTDTFEQSKSRGRSDEGSTCCRTKALHAGFAKHGAVPKASAGDRNEDDAATGLPEALELRPRRRGRLAVASEDGVSASASPRPDSCSVALACEFDIGGPCSAAVPRQWARARRLLRLGPPTSRAAVCRPIVTQPHGVLEEGLREF
ncbi:MLH3 [Symbiodinium sp. CCMP2592]|nr:MLH3 [Symbiodinium sp. CCMP2592]